MSKMLWNPTNEDLSYQFAGLTYFFKPREKKKVEDACGKHLLHNLGIRGLTVLEYGDDEEKLGREAIERNQEFKKKMVIEFNQRNEMRKQTGFNYLAPTDEIKRYAIELGVKLVEAFTMRDEERAAHNQVLEENNLLKERLGKMEAMISRLLASKEQSSQIPQKEKVEIANGSLRAKGA